jgi:hypothetical protein
MMWWNFRSARANNVVLRNASSIGNFFRITTLTTHFLAHWHAEAQGLKEGRNAVLKIIVYQSTRSHIPEDSNVLHHAVETSNVPSHSFGLVNLI